MAAPTMRDALFDHEYSAAMEANDSNAFTISNCRGKSRLSNSVKGSSQSSPWKNGMIETSSREGESPFEYLQSYSSATSEGKSRLKKSGSVRNTYFAPQPITNKALKFVKKLFVFPKAGSRSKYNSSNYSLAPSNGVIDGLASSFQHQVEQDRAAPSKPTLTWSQKN